MLLLKTLNSLSFSVFGQGVFHQTAKRRLQGSLLMVLGFLLSPLCWWNDLIFNLPIAYGFGYLCHLLVKSWLVPGAIAGYWLSNVVGIVLMQMGSQQVLRKAESSTNFKQAVWSGILSSTAFTVIIVLLIYCQILDIDSFNPKELFASFQG